MIVEDKNVIIQTKLIRPQVPSDFVPRIALLKRLNQNRYRPLTLISAPAGYGKSTLASSWLDSLSAPHAWLSLDEYNSDLIEFVTYFIAAIQTIFPEVGHETMRLMNIAEQPVNRQLLGQILNELNEIDHPFFLVLDDYHLIQDPSIHEFLIELLRFPPKALHLVVCTRHDPPMPLPSMQARNQVIVVRSADLSFSAAEVAVFCEKNLNKHISRDTIAQLFQYTEGWITGLRLIFLSIRTQPDPDTFLINLSQNPHLITEYLVIEVLNQLEPDIRAFLLKTAILDRLCGPLSEAVTKIEDPICNGQAYLEWLEKSNLFLIPLDNQRIWYRYHHLFQQHLQQEVARQYSPGEIAVLHFRASQWYADNNYIEEAILHALQANEIEFAISLVADYRHTLIDQENFHLLERRIKLFDPEIVINDPRLQIIQAWVHNVHSRHEEELVVLEKVEKLLTQSPLPNDVTGGIQGEVHLLRASIAANRGDVPEVLANTDQAIASIPNHWQYAFASAHMLKGFTYLFKGQMREAESYYQLKLNSPEFSDQRHSSLLHFGLVGTHWLQLEFYKMQVSADQYLKHGQLFNLPETIGVAHYYLGCLHYQQNRLAAAESHFESMANSNSTISIIYHLQSICGFILSCIAQRNLDKASAWIKKGRHILQEKRSFALLPYLEACAAEIALVKGNISAALQWANGYDPLQTDRLHLFYLPVTTWIKVKLAENDVQELPEISTAILKLIGQVRQSGFHSALAPLLPLQAQLAELGGESETALTLMEEAISLTQPAGAVRFIADAGPGTKFILTRLQNRGIAPDFINSILAIMPSSPVIENEYSDLQSGNVILDEPLTDRELEILILLSQRLTNKEISRRLFITHGTVRQHTNRIYKKLDVSGRHAAVAKSKELGILN